jgi:hypothetical protein
VAKGRNIRARFHPYVRAVADPNDLVRVRFQGSSFPVPDPAPRISKIVPPTDSDTAPKLKAARAPAAADGGSGVGLRVIAALPLPGFPGPFAGERLQRPIRGIHNARILIEPACADGVLGFLGPPIHQGDKRLKP